MKKKQKHAGGRPPKYTKAEDIQNKIDEYFNSCFTILRNENGNVMLDYDGNVRKRQIKPFTITGLGLALGMSRQDLINYSKKDEFFDTIKKAKMRVENYLEEKLISDGCSTGIIFNLKNNYGWKDKQELEHTGNLKLEDVL